jgi:nucleoid-associated protein YgaU
MTTSGRMAKGLTSIALAVGLLVAVPTGLGAISRRRFGSINPLDGAAPPWRWSGRQIIDAARRPLDDDAVVEFFIRAALAVVWIAIVVIAVTSIVEIVHMIRHRGLPAPRVRGIAWAQPLARTIASGLIALGSFASASPSVAAFVDGGDDTTPRHVLAALDDPNSGATIDHDGDAWPRRPAPARQTLGADRERVDTSTEQHEPASPTREYVVQRGDSIWAIAEQLVGGPSDPARTMEVADAILDLNLGRVMSDGQRFSNPALIRDGWTLDLPTTSTDPAGDLSIDDPPVADDVDTARAEPDGAGTYIVVPGDTLSSIAASELGDADAWPDIVAANAGREVDDDTTLDDPNLILPGWALALPDLAESPELDVIDDPIHPPFVPSTEFTPSDDSTPADEPTNDSPPDTDAVATDTAVDGSDADVERPEDAVATPTPHLDEPLTSTLPTTTAPTAASTTTTPASTSSTSTTTTSTSTSTSTSTTVAPVTGDGDAGSVAPPESPAAPSPIRLEHAGLVAVGILALAAVRRRQRLRAALPHARIPAPPPDVAATRRRLRSVEPGEGAARLDIALRAAARHLAETGARVGLVRLGHDGRVALRLTADAVLPAPWTGTGCDWELAGSIPIELLADDARRAGAPCVALAYIGIDDEDDDVLIDLEAAGVFAVEARPGQADDVVRALAAGVASSLHAEVAHLVTAGLGTDCLLGHPNRHGAPSVTAALELARSLAASTNDPDRSTFDLRALRTSGEVWEPAIVLLGSSDGDAEPDSRKVAVSAPTDCAVAVVATTTPRGLAHAGARLIAHADRWELIAFGEGSAITPLGVSSDDIEAVNDVLIDASTPIDQTSIPTDLGSDEHTVDEPYVSPPHEIIVRVLGSIEITTPSGDRASFERSKTVELIAWLATHRHRSTRTAARTALWELDVRDATFANVVSEARRGLARLVDPPDGEEWVARTLNDTLPLHDLVVTDADLVAERLAHARLAAPSHAIDLLRPAVEAIRDLPFAGTSYLWPDADGLTSDLVVLTTTVAAELAGHALSIGDTDTVFWATGRGLRVLPGHEELVALRMRAHARTGDLAGVRQEWASYERVIIADAWSDGEPAPKLLALRRELLAPS